MNFETAFAALPLVAILRGLTPETADAVGEALVGAGFSLIEVPLNSPRPFESIERLAKRLDGRAVLGAGTVLEPADVARVQAAGGALVIAPNTDVRVIGEAAGRGLVAIPGVFTPSEAFAALGAGAVALKLFPAEGLSPAVMKAMRAVLPPATRLLPVGGIGPDTMGGWWQAGADGFGLGSALFTPGMAPEEVGKCARAFVQALGALRGG